MARWPMARRVTIDVGYVRGRHASLVRRADSDRREVTDCSSANENPGCRWPRRNRRRLTRPPSPMQMTTMRSGCSRLVAAPAGRAWFMEPAVGPRQRRGRRNWRKRSGRFANVPTSTETIASVCRRLRHDRRAGFVPAGDDPARTAAVEERIEQADVALARDAERKLDFAPEQRFHQRFGPGFASGHRRRIVAKRSGTVAGNWRVPVLRCHHVTWAQSPHGGTRIRTP